jgi:hypothetical protein
MSASTYVYVTEMQALASGGTMPGGGMLAQKDGDMPSIDMNAAVATAGSTTTGMPAGAMDEVATEAMPVGDMRSATASSAVQTMPGGAMLASSEDDGMPSGSMLAAAGDVRA